MTLVADETHDPARRSWVASANGHPDFPIQNLPFGVFRTPRSAGGRIGVAIGDQVLDVAACAGLLQGAERAAADGDAWKRVKEACAASSLNEIMALEPEDRQALRLALSRLLAADPAGRPLDGRAGPHLLVPVAEVEMLVPAEIGDYTDA